MTTLDEIREEMAKDLLADPRRLEDLIGILAFEWGADPPDEILNVHTAAQELLERLRGPDEFKAPDYNGD